MPIRLLFAVLLLLGPMPFRYCACGAEHATTEAGHEDGTPVHHDPDCPMAKPPHPKPAVTVPVASIAVDLDACVLEPLAELDPSWPCLVSDEPARRDRSVPFWLVHLAIQI